MDPAIEIMPDVLPSFVIHPLIPRSSSSCVTHTCITVAYKRFVDNVLMGIDRTLVRGMAVGLEGVLFSGLAINGPEHMRSARRL